MNITIVEHGSLGLCLARNLSRYHRVHLLRSQESALDEPLAELDGVLTPVDQQGLQNLINSTANPAPTGNQAPAPASAQQTQPKR